MLNSKNEVKALASIMDNPDLLPKFTESDIKNRYPDLTDAEVKGLIKPAETRALIDDINKDPFISDKGRIAQMIQDNGGTNPALGYAAVMKEYKQLGMSKQETYWEMSVLCEKRYELTKEELALQINRWWGRI